MLRSLGHGEHRGHAGVCAVEYGSPSGEEMKRKRKRKRRGRREEEEERKRR
jgi:hypothetical protein